MVGFNKNPAAYKLIILKHEIKTLYKRISACHNCKMCHPEHLYHIKNKACIFIDQLQSHFIELNIKYFKKI